MEQEFYDDDSNEADEDIDPNSKKVRDKLAQI
jgi:hypothetical protein